MKHTYLLIFLLALSFLTKAQAPNMIPYQAVVRNTDGTVMTSASIIIIFKIHDVSATGAVVYEETHSTTSNPQGLVSLNIGAGDPNIGSFATIGWGTGAKFLQVSINAGSGDIDLGTQQMMSVPYALYAEDVIVRVSATGDTLFIGNNYSIVPGVSAANPVSISNSGAVLLPGNNTCQNEYISVTGCGGQDSLLYFDRYYNLLEIGGQCWFGESLGSAQFNNGDSIPQSEYMLNENWSPVDKAWRFYLYNHTVLEDGRNSCPSGFHVATLCDYHFLFMSQGISVEQLNSSVALYLPSLNSPDAYPGNNSSGFNALYDIWVPGPDTPVIRILTNHSQIPAGIVVNYANWNPSSGNAYNNGQIRCIKD
jgi:uncharacterized protein (TIGR02145 family)